MALYEYAANDPINAVDPDGGKVIRRHVKHVVKRVKHLTWDGRTDMKGKFTPPTSCKKRRGGKYGFDVYVDMTITTSFLDNVDPDVRSDDEPDYTLREHEKHHSNDFEFGRDDVDDPTEGFGSLDACKKAAGQCPGLINRYFDELERRTRTRDRHGY